jgi:hypothetical protein
MDCSGFVGYVLSEIGLKYDPAGLNTKGLFDLDIWSEHPDTNAFGEYAELFAVYFNDHGNGPNGTLDHSAIRYNWAYASHVTGGYFETGHKNSIGTIRDNIRSLFGNVDWLNGDDTFNGAAFKADIVGVLTQGLEPTSIVRSVVENILLGPDDINSVQSNDTNLKRLVRPDYDGNENTEPGLVQRAYDMLESYMTNYAFVGGIIGMVRDSFKEVEDPALEAQESVTYASVSSPYSAIDVIAETYNGMLSSDAISWTVGQLTSSDKDGNGQKNGAQTFPVSRVYSKMNGPFLVRYLKGSDFSKHFGVV